MKRIEANVLIEREKETNTFLMELPDTQDPRSKRGRSFSIGELFLVILCAQICSFESLREYETYGKTKLGLLRRFLPYKRGAPAKSTIARILALCRPCVFRKWIVSCNLKQNRII